jgi:C4-dicarboxylate-specific signal transduction histidine kinase
MPTLKLPRLLERRFRWINFGVLALVAVMLALFFFVLVRGITLQVAKGEAELHSSIAAAQISGHFDREQSLLASLGNSLAVQAFFTDEKDEAKREACFKTMENYVQLLHAQNI